MAAKRKRAKQSKPQPPARPARRGATALRLRQVAGQQAWELVHPRCALDRAEDIDEVRKMIDAGEFEIAQDELRWLLNGCGDFMDAHQLLGELALLAGDLPLARGHFGYAFGLGVKALQQAQSIGPLPYHLPSNQSFHQAGKGLALCLKQLNKPEMAADVVEQLLRHDPADPLGVKGLGGSSAS